MQGKKMFRGSLFGYNKKDVNEYISILSQETSGLIEALEEKSRDMGERMEAAFKESELLSVELAQKAGDLFEEREKLLRLENELQKAKGDDAELKRELEEAKKAFAIREEELLYHRDSLNSQSARLEFLESELNRHTDEKMSIADVIITAREQADAIVERAADSANEINERAKDYIRRASRQLTLACAQIEEARSKMMGIYSGADTRAGEAVTAIEILESDMNDLLSEFLLKEKGPAAAQDENDESIII